MGVAHVLGKGPVVLPELPTDWAWLHRRHGASDMGKIEKDKSASRPTMAEAKNGKNGKNV